MYLLIKNLASPHQKVPFQLCVFI